MSFIFSSLELYGTDNASAQDSQVTTSFIMLVYWCLLLSLRYFFLIVYALLKFFFLCFDFSFT